MMKTNIHIYIYIGFYAMLRRGFSSFLSLMALKEVHLGINPNQYSFLIQDCPNVQITIVLNFSESSKCVLRQSITVPSASRVKYYGSICL